MKTITLLFKGLKKGMQNFGNDLTTMINSALLLIVYIIGVGITCLFSKLFKKKFLETKLSRKNDSYWSELNLKKQDISHYYRQF